MTFDVLEESNYLSVPIVLYKFSRGIQQWNYTSADQDVTMNEREANTGIVNAIVYTAVPISDAGVSVSPEPSQDQLVVTLPWDSPVVTLFAHTPPSEPVQLEVAHTHFGDPSVEFVRGARDASRRLMWTGTISAVKRTNPGTAEITCVTAVQSFDRNGLRLGWSRNCPYVLYDPKTCKADKTLHSVTGVVLAIDDVNVQVAEFAGFSDGALAAGSLEWVVYSRGDPILYPPVFERRVISGHAGNSIRLIGTTEGITVGMTVTAYRGCDRTITTCNDVFANIDNNGSDPFLPGVSPFDGNPVF